MWSASHGLSPIITIIVFAGDPGIRIRMGFRTLRGEDLGRDHMCAGGHVHWSGAIGICKGLLKHEQTKE